MIHFYLSGDSNNRQGTRIVATGVSLLLVIVLVLYAGKITAQTLQKVQRFDVNGLTLRMDLDQVIKLYNINNVKVNKDAYGIVNGYEIKKRINQKKAMIILHFTGEKRLYRIHYSQLHDKYRYHSKELYELLVNKYGSAWTDNAREEGSKNRNMYACWGSSCKKYPRTTPILTAKIHHSSGRLELVLADNRIFTRDWKLYKQKLSGQLTDRNKVIHERKGGDSDF